MRPVFAALALLLSFNTYGFAAEGWVCTEKILDEQFESDYVVVGESLVMNKGRGHATILLNDEQAVKAYVAIWSDGPRLKWKEKENRTVVELTGPHDNPVLITEYLIINESQNTLITLDNVIQSENAPLVQDLAPRAKKSPYRRADQ
jgi:hypothetical protein